MNETARKTVAWQNEKTYGRDKPANKPSWAVAPANQEAEQALIGAILTDPKLFIRLRSEMNVKPEDFFYIRHGYIWRAMELLTDRDAAIDIVTVNAELGRVGVQDEVGGLHYLMQLVNSTPNTYHANAYTEAVKDTASSRNLLTAGAEIQAIAVDSNLTAAEKYTAAYILLNSITAGEIDPRRSEIGTHVDAWVTNMERIIDQQEIPMLKTGIKGIDNTFGGLRRRQVTILAAPTGFGKSTASISSIGFNAAKMGHGVVIMSNEEDEEEIISRFVAAEIGIPLKDLMSGNVPPKKYPLLLAVTDRIRKMNVHVLYMPDMTPGLIRQELDRIQQESLVELLILDGLKSIEPDVVRGGDEGQRRTRQLKDIMKALTKMAKDKNLPVLAAHHFNRDEDGHSKTPPKIQNIAEGSAIEQYAQTIWALWRPPSGVNELVEQDGAEPTKLVSIKGRFTHKGEVDLRFEVNGSYYTTDERRYTTVNINQSGSAGDMR